MIVNNQKVYDSAFSIIHQLYGAGARFRDGQYEAIEATLVNNRTLVVQRTGWGKSLVYFVCTKILRNEGKGVTMVVSPLLVLMENQIEAARKLGLRCDVLNSTVGDRRAEIIQNIISDQLDLILVTPETLFKEDLQNVLKDIRIGLFVIDEAHCISDWGHDFRLEYGNLYKVLSVLPKSVPVLATTATANNRVVEDLNAQLGGNVYISRGSLTRESLAIQVLNLKSKAERYAWILQNIMNLSGSGIIYCLTQRDCDYLSDFLNKNGIPTMSYYSRAQDDEEKNRIAEEKFKNNDIKAIVATIKLGMGYDKGDIGFVIHFQQPSNIVSYYQQIGRAGRNIPCSNAFLLCGKEDNEILDYFINTAFPTEKEETEIVKLLEKSNGMSAPKICSELNVKKSLVDKALQFLVNEGFLSKSGTKYYLTPKLFKYNREHYEAITSVRFREKEQMSELIRTSKCYSKFIVNCLDDFSARDCGICSNCIGEEIIPLQIASANIENALNYINSLIIKIEPRKRWAITDNTGATSIGHINETGICLSKYGDVGYGELVKRDKYAKSERFCDELVGKSSEVLKPLIMEEAIKYITCVPSLRSGIVEDFTKRLADSCGIEFVPTLSKRVAEQQKLMQNSSHQCKNALSSFFIENDTEVPERIILVDDIVDSKWTLTVCGYRLMEKGCLIVFPFALADSSQKED